MKLFPKISIIVFLLFICIFISGADSLHAGWPFISGSVIYDDVFKDVCTLNGYVYSGGYTVDGTDTSFYLVKFDLNGNLEWDNIYCESDEVEDEVLTCIFSSENSIILAGNRNNIGPYIIKISEDGYRSDTFVHHDNLPDPDEVTVGAGNEQPGNKEGIQFVFTGSAGDDIFLMKTDNNLNLIDFSEIESEENEIKIAYGIKNLEGNQHIIVGSCNQGSGEFQYIAKLNYNGEGRLINSWDTLLSPGELFAIKEDTYTTDRFFAVGYDNSTSQQELTIICLNSESVEWVSNAYTDPGVNEVGYDIAFSGGDIYVVGTTVNAAGIEGTIISKFLTDGTYVSSQRNYLSDNQGWYGITSIPSNDFVVVGYTEVEDNEEKDAFADETYPFLDPESIGGTGGAMSNYSASIGIIDNTDETNIILYQTLPCIFSKEAHLSFSLPFNRYVELKIYDITGSEIKTLVNSYMSSGDHSFIWNRDDNTGTEVSYGIYFCKLIVEGEVFTRKITLTQ